MAFEIIKLTYLLTILSFLARLTDRGTSYERERQRATPSEQCVRLTRMYVSDDLVLDQWKDGRQLAQLSLRVHLAQRRADEVVVEPVERQVLSTVRVRSAHRTYVVPLRYTTLLSLSFTAGND